MSHIWKINGANLSLDLTDADAMERYETAFDKMSVEEKEIPKDGKASVRIRAYCQLFRNLFDRIFGEGASEKIFAGVPVSTSEYDKIYAQFLEYVKSCGVAATEARTELIAKYTPNRAQRRASKKKK